MQRPLGQWLGIIFCAAACAAVCALSTAHAQVPAMRADIEAAVKVLPLPGLKEIAVDLYNDAKKEASVLGWHSARKGNFQLHLYSKGDVQMAFVVYDGSLRLSAIPFAQGGAWKRFGDAEFVSPFFSLSIAETQSISPTDAGTPRMFADVLKKTYPSLAALSVEPGIQLFTKASISGAVGSVISTMGAPAGNFWMRAGMTGDAPQPTDVSGVKVRKNAAMRNANMVENLNNFVSAADRVNNADLEERRLFVEITMPPGTKWTAPFGMQDVNITDATIFVDASPSIGFMGNAGFSQVPGKSFVMYFSIPFEGTAPKWPSSQMALSTPGAINLAEFATIGLALQTATVGAAGKLLGKGAMAQKGINNVKNMLYPLRAFTIRNPATGVRFVGGGEFPDLSKFNIVVIGEEAKSPTGQPGPFIAISGEAAVLGQTLATTRTTMTNKALSTNTTGKLSLDLSKVGMGAPGFDTRAIINISETDQLVQLTGKFDIGVAKRSLAFNFSPEAIALNSPAECLSPIEVNGRVLLSQSPSMATVMGALKSISIDPKLLGSCTAEQLKAIAEAAEKAALLAAEETKKVAEAAAKAISDAAQVAAAESARAAAAAASAAAAGVANAASAAYTGGTAAAGNVYRGAKKLVEGDGQSSTCNARIESIRRNGIYPDDKVNGPKLVAMYTEGWSYGEAARISKVNIENNERLRAAASSVIEDFTAKWNASAPGKGFQVPAYQPYQVPPSIAALEAIRLSLQKPTEERLVNTSSWVRDFAPYDANTPWRRCASAWIAGAPMDLAREIKAGIAGSLPGGEAAEAVRNVSAADYARLLASIGAEWQMGKQKMDAQNAAYREFAAAWSKRAVEQTDAILARMNDAVREIRISTLIPDQRALVDPFMIRAKQARAAANPLWYPVQNDPKGVALRRMMNVTEQLSSVIASTGYDRTLYLLRVQRGLRAYDAALAEYSTTASQTRSLSQVPSRSAAVDKVLMAYAGLITERDVVLRELKITSASQIRSVRNDQLTDLTSATEALEGLVEDLTLLLKK